MQIVGYINTNKNHSHGQKLKFNINVLSEMRTRDPSNQEAAEPHFRLQGQRDLLISGLLFSKFPTV